jgi:dTDP-4-amino-4,6-dideoxygalactose transaminase
MIPLFKVFMSEDVDGDLLNVIHGGYIAEGIYVKQFEECLSYLWNIDSKRIVTLNSGTSSLAMAIHLCNIQEADEVITTPMTCVATNLYLLHRKAKIIWSDVNPITGLIDPQDVSNKISLKTKAIVAVDYGGYACNYVALRKFGIPIIEDAALAILTQYNGKLVVNNGGDFVCFSFQAIKHLTCGDGGAIVVPDQYIERARLLRWYGLDRDGPKSLRYLQDIKEAGYKFHMNNIDAIIGIHNLSHVHQVVESHKNNALYLSKNIVNKKVIVPEYDIGSSYGLFTILVEERTRFMRDMGEKGIETRPINTRNDTYTVFHKFRVEGLKGVDFFSARNVSVPVGWWLSEKDLDIIIDSINNWR